MLDQHTINLLERLVIAEEKQAKELETIRKELQSRRSIVANGRLKDKLEKFKMEAE